MITMDTTSFRERLQELHAPVKDWQIESGSDWSGDDAVYVLAIVDDETLDQLPQTDRIVLRERITRAINPNAYDSTPIVYIRFRAASEA